MHWGANGEHWQCCGGWPAEEGRGRWGCRTGPIASDRAEEEGLQGSHRLCQADPLENCRLLLLLVPVPHHRVCLLLHHPLSRPTTVPRVMEQDLQWFRLGQRCADGELVASARWPDRVFCFHPTASYDFLSIQDASKDKVMDVLFVLRDTEGTLNNTCADAGVNFASVVWYLVLKWARLLLDVLRVWPGMRACFPGLPSPCVFMLALDGTDGETLWERPLQPEFHWAQCGLEKDSGRNWDCLLSHSNQLSALDKYSGQWQVLFDALRVTRLCWSRHLNLFPHNEAQLKPLSFIVIVPAVLLTNWVLFRLTNM